MLKKVFALVFVFSILVSGVSANSFWANLFGLASKSAFVDSVSLTGNPSQFAENVGNAIINVERTGGDNNAFSVDYTTLDNSATAGNDYVLTQGTLNFAAGETTKQILVPIIDDADGENTEYFAVQLSTATNGVNLGNSFVFFQIDPDEPVFTIQGSSGLESNDATIQVYRQGTNLNSVATVDFATSNDTAIAVQDYVAQNGTLNFAADETFKTITVSVINDAIIEAGLETFFVTLSNPSSGTAIVGTNPAISQINDDDQQFVYVQDANNGNPITEGNDAVFNVSRQNGDLTQPLTVDFTTANGTATSPDDYTSQNGTITFAANETDKTIAIATVNDFTVEPNEQFTVDISNASGGVLITGTTASATLTDNNTPMPERLAFASKYNTTDIFAVNDNDTNFANLTNTPANAEVEIDYNKINGKIIFRCGIHICTMNRDGSDRTTIYNSPYFSSEPSWSPNGNYVVFDNSDRLGLLNVATNTYTDVVNNASMFPFNSPQISPDNSKIAFIANDGNGNELWIVNLDGSNLIQLTNLDQFSAVPNWSPDGTKIVFGSGTNQFATNDIYTINADGTSLANLTNTPAILDASPSFSPDGTKIAYSSDETITLMNSDGTSVQTFVGGKYPSWSPSGTKLAFHGNYSLKALTVIDGNVYFDRNIDNDDIADMPVEWLPESTVASNNVVFEFGLSSVDETAGSVDITVKRIGTNTDAFSVDYATTNGTATAGSDYTSAAGTLNFAVGEVSKTINIPITDDANPESDETFTAALSNPTNGITLGSNPNHIVTISANDLPTIQFTTSLTTVNEDAGNVTIEITRSGNLNIASQVTFSTVDGTATGSTDYFGFSRIINFAEGETSKTVEVAIFNDTNFEPAERFSFILYNISGATLGSPASAEIEISASDTVPVVQFISVLDRVVEGAGNTIFNVTVRRTGNLTGSSTVDFTTAPNIACDVPSQPPGCAIAAQDYLDTSGTLTFAPNETSKTFPVTILHDEMVESDEYFSVILRNPDTGTIIGSPSRNELQIERNEVNLFTFEFQGYSFNEGVVTAIVGIRKTKVFQNAITCSVNYSTSGGTAISGQDFTPTSGTLTFGSLDSIKTISIPINDDVIPEDNETFSITLSNPVNGGFNTFTPTQTVNIIDNEPILIQTVTHLMKPSETST
jgi:Tol biopolymer transport system component